MNSPTSPRASNPAIGMKPATWLAKILVARATSSEPSHMVAVPDSENRPKKAAMRSGGARRTRRVRLDAYCAVTKTAISRPRPR